MSHEISSYQDPRLQPEDDEPSRYQSFRRCVNGDRCMQRWLKADTKERAWDYLMCSDECANYEASVTGNVF